MNGIPALDQKTLDELDQLGGKPFLREMIDLFLMYVDAKINAATAAQQEGDLAALREAVHPIKSSASNVGALRVKSLAMRLEQQAALNVADDLVAQLQDLRAAFEEVRPLLMRARDNPTH